MRKILKKTHQIVVRSLLAGYLIAYPLYSTRSHVYAQETPSPIITTQEEENTTAPPDQSYTYNPDTNKWENGTYSWDPETNQTTPLSETPVSYNPETDHWDTEAWRYDSKQESYVKNDKDTSIPVLENQPGSSESTGTVQPQLDLYSPTALSIQQKQQDNQTERAQENYFSTNILG